MYYLFVGSRWRKEGSYHYEKRGEYNELCDAIWNFFDYKKSLENHAGSLYGDTELHLTIDPELSFADDNGIIFSAFNVNDRVCVRSNLKGYLDYGNFEEI